MGLHKFDIKKELKKLDFKNNKSKYIKIGSITLLSAVLLVSIIYFTYSKFTLSDTFQTAETTVNDFIPADYILNYYINGTQVTTAPSSGSYDVSISCDKGATATWNEDTWSINILNATESYTRCNVNFTPIYVDASGASTPELYAGLIPITYNDDNSIIIANTNIEWYNYGNHEWANAILIDQSNATIKAKYLNDDGTYKAGTEVDIADVLQMYVWIPRYKYQLFNVEGLETTAQMINVKFESSITTKSSGSENGEWLTHPAFTFGSTELNGIWIGKFESSGTISDITIKPNVSSLRNINISQMFNASRAIETTTKYGLSSSEVDTHMMKNMEWGAVAYLTNSKYGRYESTGSCIESGCEIWINNNSSYTTGCSGDSVVASETTLCNQWNTAIGVNASTTNNIYGIYDMSGGADEYVMGSMLDSNGDFYPLNSGFTKAPGSKYFDFYNYSDDEFDYSRGKKKKNKKKVMADTVGGFSWYDAYAYFVNSSDSWFTRSGSINNNPGLFHFDRTDGNAYLNYSFRVALVQ